MGGRGQRLHIETNAHSVLSSLWLGVCRTDPTHSYPALHMDSVPSPWVSLTPFTNPTQGLCSELAIPRACTVLGTATAGLEGHQQAGDFCTCLGHHEL